MTQIIMSDIHLHNWTSFSKSDKNGTNTRLLDILNAIREAVAQLESGDRLYITGDLFHVRGQIAPSVMNPTLELFEEIVERGIVVRVIPGNHDLESKETHRLTNAVQALKGLGVEVVNETKIFEDDKVIMIPWVDKLDDLRHTMLDVRMDLEDDPNDPGYAPQEEYTLMIHAPLNGVINIPDNGLTPDELDDLGFKRVLCGHYHNHKIFDGGVISVGALTHQSYRDIDSLAGYIQIDDDDALTHHVTSAPKFIEFDPDWTEEECINNCAGNYVRVSLGEVTEKEIVDIRNAIVNEYEALAVTIKSSPKTKTATRSSTSVSNGASIEKSIEAWVKDNIDSSQRRAVTDASLKTLEEINLV